ncbi:MAG: outer membrane beta-barrel protein [Deltaproteobacteria bacterium]|nr:outer membrane beta-barrel protein [Deltaproteobacteria bacterium]
MALAPAPGRAQQFEQGLSDPRILSPAGLGPRYSGLVGAGVGLVSKKPRFGVTAGEFVIQPRFFLEGEFRTNFFRVDSRASDPEGVFALHIRPGVALFNPEFDKVALTVGVDLDVFMPLTGGEAATDQTNLGGRAQLSAAFFPKSAFTLTLHERFERTLWMRPQITTNGNQNRNVIGVDGSFHPGGRALDFTLGYAFDLTRYDDIERIDMDEHHLRFLASWRFYPMTYTFIESTMTISRYLNPIDGAEELAGNFVDGTPVKVYGGLSGYITERLAVLVRAGYGNSLLDRDEGFSSFIGQLQASWRFSPTTIIHAGIARDFDLAPLGGYYDYLRPYLELTLRLGELVDLNVDFAYDLRNYGAWEPAPIATGDDTLTPTASNPNRSEGAIRGGLVLDFDMSRLLGATIGYRYDSVISDYAIFSGSATNFIAYDDHRLFASFNLRY